MAYIKGNTGLGVADWVQDLIKSGTQTFENIATARWGNPPPGVAIQTPTGSYVRAPNTPGAQIGVFPPMDFGGAGGDILKWGLIAAVVVGGVAVLKR